MSATGVEELRPPQNAAETKETAKLDVCGGTPHTFKFETYAQTQRDLGKCLKVKDC